MALSGLHELTSSTTAVLVAMTLFPRPTLRASSSRTGKRQTGFALGRTDRQTESFISATDKRRVPVTAPVRIKLEKPQTVQISYADHFLNGRRPRTRSSLRRQGRVGSRAVRSDPPSDLHLPCPISRGILAACSRRIFVFVESVRRG